MFRISDNALNELIHRIIRLIGTLKEIEQIRGTPGNLIRDAELELLGIRRKLLESVNEGGRQGMNFKVTFTKALQGGLTYLAAILAANQGVIVDYVTTAVGVLIAGLVVGVTNWLKNKSK